MSTILFSIVIITRNRAAKLQHTLDSVKSIEFPREQYEVIIVDNGSTDSTAEVSEKFFVNTNINHQVVIENRPGICRARNKGIESADGETVLFLDDDALINSNLLDVYKDARSRYPNAAAFGGPARLDPAIPRPWWWIDEFDKTMSCQNYGEHYLTYPEGANPYGLNMLIKRDVLRAVGGFDERLDDLTGSFADETELFLRLKKRGETIIYVPDAGVIHSVMPDRLQWRNFMNRFRLVGRSHACLDRMHNTYHARRLLRRMASALALFIKHGSPAVFFTELYAWDGYRRFRSSGPGVIPVKQQGSRV